jgi:hypothetical protein
MVTAVGSATTPKTTASKLSFNASTGALAITGTLSATGAISTAATGAALTLNSGGTAADTQLKINRGSGTYWSVGHDSLGGLTFNRDGTDKAYFGRSGVDGLTVTGTVSASGTGGFASSTYASGVRNPIWRFGNADGYGLSYFQGTAGIGTQDTFGFHFGTATAAASTLRIIASTGVAVTGTLSASGAISASNFSGSSSGTNTGDAASLPIGGGTLTGALTINGSTLTVGNTTSSNINMVDTDEGTRIIHCNSNRIGFLTQAGGWGAYCDDSGNWAANNLSGTNTGDQTNISGNAATATLAANSSLLSGLGLTSAASGNSVMQRDANGYAYWQYGNQASPNNENGGISQIIITNGDNFFRKSSIANLAGYMSGSAMNISGSSTSCSGNSSTATTATYLSGTAQNTTIIGRNGQTVDINGANDTGSFSVRGDTTYPASISFHRTGAYAINMGVSNGNVFVIGGWSATANAFQMTSGGALTMASNITAYSDERHKTNWRDLPDDFIEQLSKVKHGIYDRTDIVDTQVGVSAQSLRPVLENAIMENEGGILSVSYGNAALVSAVQLAKEVVSLKGQMAMLMDRLNKLENN